MDEVILAEIVFLGSQFITKFDQIFYHILTDFILLSLLFCFLVSVQDNHKLVKARFVWWVVGWRLNGFWLRVVSEILPAIFFFQSILLEWFLKREVKRVKKFVVVLALNKSEERSEKRVVFVHTAVFEKARNWCVKKFSKRAKFFCSRAAF